MEKKNPDASTLVDTNQSNTDKQNVEKKIGDVDKKIPDTSGLQKLKLIQKLVNLITKHHLLVV